MILGETLKLARKRQPDVEQAVALQALPAAGSSAAPTANNNNNSSSNNNIDVGAGVVVDGGVERW